MNINTLRKARELAGAATPLRADCGKHCGHACCGTDEDGQGGVYLFPGEETLYEGAGWARIEEGRMLEAPAKILYCQGECPRDERPLGCRIFPLTADLSRGEVKVRYDFRARPMCPLIKSGLRGLDPVFVENVEKALRLIASDPEGLAFLKKWEEMERQYDFHL